VGVVEGMDVRQAAMMHFDLALGPRSDGLAISNWNKS
jgi:hypothetical protein